MSKETKTSYTILIAVLTAGFAGVFGAMALGYVGVLPVWGRVFIGACMVLQLTVIVAPLKELRRRWLNGRATRLAEEIRRRVAEHPRLKDCQVRVDESGVIHLTVSASDGEPVSVTMDANSVPAVSGDGRGGGRLAN